MDKILMDLQKLKFPIGEYKPTKQPDKKIIFKWIKVIEDFPDQLERLMPEISTEKLNYKYRPGGWTVKQVIHHCADGHMNSFIRFKLALTEDTPSIRPYFEDKWAELIDAQDDNVEYSIKLINGLHKKWCLLLKNLNDDQLKVEFIHPQHSKRFNLAENIGLYAWHCDHHLAHIKNGLKSNGKYN